LAGVGVKVQILGDGPPVVLLHGGPNAGSTWALLMPYLTRFHCYVVDRAGDRAER
jgi:pimeloyl-ACP methyl ester carboxylesterase